MIQPYNISVLPIPEFKSRIGFWEDIPPKQHLTLMVVMLLNMYNWFTQPRQEVSEGF